MEEILASIRRIISEDAGPAPFAAEPVRKAAAPQATNARAQDYALPPARGFGRDGVAAPSLAPLAQPVAAAAPAPRAIDTVPTAAAPAFTQPLAADDDDILDLDASYASVTRRPVAPPPAASPIAEAPAPRLAVPEVFAAEPGAAPEAVAVVAPEEPVFELTPTSAAADMPPDELLQPDPEPMPLAAAAATRTIDISEPMHAEPAMDLPAAAPVFLAEPVSVAEPVFLAEAVPVASMAAPSVAAETPREAPAAVVDAPVAIDMTPAAAMAAVHDRSLPELAAPVPVMVAEPVAAVMSTASAVMELPEVATAPVLVAVSMIPPPMAAAQAVPRTMEDMVAEMLRPMLREWLDSNMPRIVEKAIGKPGE